MFASDNIGQDICTCLNASSTNTPVANQDILVSHIKASFLIRLAVALHNNCTDLNGLITQHMRIRTISYCMQGHIYHSFILTYILHSTCTLLYFRWFLPSNNKFLEFPLSLRASVSVSVSVSLSFHRCLFSLSSQLHLVCIAFVFPTAFPFVCYLVFCIPMSLHPVSLCSPFSSLCLVIDCISTGLVLRVVTLRSLYHHLSPLTLISIWLIFQYQAPFLSVIPVHLQHFSYGSWIPLHWSEGDREIG